MTNVPFRNDNCHDQEIMKELTAFELSRERDEEHLTGLEDVDLNSHLDVFNAILKQVRTELHTYSSILSKAIIV